MAKIAELLREVRERAGLSQSELARRANMDRGHVNRIEVGEKSTKFAQLEAWAEACGARWAIVDREGDPVEVLALDARKRDVVVRLARLLKADLPEELVEDLVNRVRWWEERYTGSKSQEATARVTKSQVAS